MPEGDTAYRVARQIGEALNGQVLTRFQVRTGSLATADLRGQIVSSVEPFGKHILVRIGGYSLHSHMLMDGVWHIYARAARWRKPSHQARIVLGTDRVEVVGFSVAQVRLVPTASEGDLVGHLGPDPLKPDWHGEGMLLAAERVQQDPRPIHVALMDQRSVAGFGNEYANELCFLMGVDPEAPATSVDALAFMKLGTRLIRANRDRVERTTTGNLRQGQRSYVFGRTGLSCRRCGTQIQLKRLGADPTTLRNAHWCPVCQPPFSGVASGPEA